VLHGVCLCAGLCAGLDPVLEAVAELPEAGLPIPSSAGHRIKQFFLQQLATVTAAGSSSKTSGSSRLTSEYSKEVQTIQQLQQKLEELAAFWWDRPGLSHAKPCALKAVQLVANAARVVARQQVAERNTPAYNTLLAQGYRAGACLGGINPVIPPAPPSQNHCVHCKSLTQGMFGADSAHTQEFVRNSNCPYQASLSCVYSCDNVMYAVPTHNAPADMHRTH
jgi:hypothetical protein